MDIGQLKQMITEQLQTSRAEEGYWLGMTAFRYGYPLIEMHRSRWEWHYDPSAASHLGEINQMHHTTRRAEPGDTYFVTPIVDAPYSRTFADLSGGPVVIEVPPIDDRYFTVQLLEMYTNSFAYIGSRLGDVHGGRYLVTGPGWRGPVPDGITRVISAPTPVICVLARVAILDDDVAATVALQTQIRLTPVSRATPPDPAPYLDFKNGDPLDFYRMLAGCLTENPPPGRDAGVLGLLARIGIASHHAFDPDQLHPAAAEGLAKAVKAGIQSLYAEMPFIAEPRNGWIMPDLATVGNFGTNYYLRLEISQIGILANSSDEAYYVGIVADGDGEPLIGDRRYVLHFGPGDCPPVEAFWSLTMYLNPEGFLVENPARIYHRGSLTPGLRYSPDGSLDIYIQRESPGADKESNWLPCTEPGKLFRLILRQYIPQAGILSGAYTPPPIERVP
jgi:hypothetical protein